LREHERNPARHRHGRRDRRRGGGLIGAATAGGNKGKSAATGAAVGAALGAGGGYLWSQNMQKQRAEMEQATAGTGIGISQTTDNQLKVDIPPTSPSTSAATRSSPTCVRCSTVSRPR
jgi:hypothetical protein